MHCSKEQNYFFLISWKRFLKYIPWRKENINRNYSGILNASFILSHMMFFYRAISWLFLPLGHLCSSFLNHSSFWAIGFLVKFKKVLLIYTSPSIASSYWFLDFHPFLLYSSCHKCILRNTWQLWLIAYNMPDQGKDSLPVRVMELSSVFPSHQCSLS